jgi:hypothetical protein
MYEVKNVKTFHGHDGGCWECTLYCNGKRVAIVTEDGWGGELQFNWLTSNRTICGVCDASKALDAHCLTLPKWELYDGEMTHMTADIHVGDLVNAFLQTKDLKKMLKKVTVYVDGALRCYKVGPDRLDEKGRATIKDHFPKGVILNDLTIDEAMVYYKKAA